MQVTSFMMSGLNQNSYLPRLNNVYEFTNHRQQSYVEWIPFFNDTYAVSSSQGEFYDPALIDLVFQDSAICHSKTNYPTRLLHVQGSLLSDEWSRYLLKNPITLDDDYEPEDELSFDVLRFSSTSAFWIDTPLHELSDKVVKALLSLPTERAQLIPTFTAHHNVDLTHFLQASSKSVSEDKSTFPLLLHTGCSVSCSGFKEDFRGQLPIEDFGHVNTADGKAKIEGFGMLRWDVIATHGTRLTILVPAYFSPNIQMR